MSPEASNEDLLYVADYASNKVYVFSYPQAEQVGTLSGFDGPWGECVNERGDVWITNFVKRNVVKYAHGGTKPVKSLADSSGYPIACAVDPATGNLAVANVYGQKNGPGSVVIFNDKSKTPKKYMAATFYYYYSAAYDANGDLFVDGTTRTSDFHLTELGRGKTSFKGVELNKEIRYPVGVQWLGTYLAIGGTTNTSSGVSGVLRVRVANQVGTILGKTKLHGPIGAFVVVGGSRVVASQGDAVVYFGYPGGGSPTKRIKGFDYPLGVTISRAP